MRKFAFVLFLLISACVFAQVKPAKAKEFKIKKAALSELKTIRELTDIPANATIVMFEVTAAGIDNKLLQAGNSGEEINEATQNVFKNAKAKTKMYVDIKYKNSGSDKFLAKTFVVRVE